MSNDEMNGLDVSIKEKSVIIMLYLFSKSAIGSLWLFILFFPFGYIYILLNKNEKAIALNKFDIFVMAIPKKKPLVLGLSFFHLILMFSVSSLFKTISRVLGLM